LNASDFKVGDWVKISTSYSNLYLEYIEYILDYKYKVRLI